MRTTNRKTALGLLIPLVSFVGISVLAIPSFASKFANQFTEFELPPQWQCNLEGAEWVCQSNDPHKKRDAIIVLAAKIKGDQDSLDQYLKYLNAPKTYTDIHGRPVKSEMKTAGIKNYNGQPWVDSLHLESEIPGYYTRYFATIKEDIGVLVTFSVNRNKYQDYLDDIDNLVRTLKVFRKPGGFNAVNPGVGIFDQAHIPPGITTDTVFAPQTTPMGGSDHPVKKAQGDNSLILILALVGVVGYVIWRRKQSGGGA